MPSDHREVLERFLTAHEDENEEFWTGGKWDETATAIRALLKELTLAESSGDYISMMRERLKNDFGVEAAFFDDVVYGAIAKAVEEKMEDNKRLRAEVTEVERSHAANADQSLLEAAQFRFVIVEWQKAESLPDCPACAVLDAALRGEE